MRDEEQEHVTSINTRHINTMCFPQHTLPSTIRATVDPTILHNAHVIVHAIPVQFSQPFLQKLTKYIPALAQKNYAACPPLLVTSKGISAKTLQFMNEIVASVLGEEYPACYLSGPSFAEGIILGHPTLVTLASSDDRIAKLVQVRFRIFLMFPFFPSFIWFH